ncbi:MAG: alkaline phosphatase [Phaeodactylibacter sp.]|nr:alkaline phosphatase [Phaeodactylibacter sp.]
MIGDGMGISQISAGIYANGNKANLEKFPVAGLQKTYPADGLITDSAAGATAIACGVKTYVGGVGVNKDSMPALSILEEAEMREMATGLVTTASVTGPTPAAFVAHVKSHDSVEEIATYFLKTAPDLIIGGGENDFTRRKTGQQNLRPEMEKKGYFVSGFQEQPLDEIVLPTQQKFAYFTAAEAPPPAAQGRDYLPRASNMATFFLEKRSGKNGFFLLVNGAQIGWGGQAQNNDYIVSEMIDFDRAVGEVLKFAERDGQTLVIVTATNETGGHAINPGARMDSLITAFTADKPTATLVPVFAYGPGAEHFRGIYENTAIYERMRQALGWEALPGK